MFSETDLVTRCIKGDQTGWSLFFNRYNSHIDHQIIRIFHFNSYPFTEEDFQKVKDDVIDIIRVPEKLGSITNREDAGIKAWLSSVSRNKARDYIRRRKSIRSAFEEEVNRDMVSLQDPLRSAPDHTFEDVMSKSDETANGPVQEVAKQVISMIEDMDAKYRIPLKLYLIFHDYLLSSDEINNIAVKRGVTTEAVKKEINQLIDRLLKKNEQSIKKEGKITVLAAYINRLESRLYYLRHYPAEQHQKILEVEEELRKKEQQLQKLQDQQSTPAVPSSREIGAIVGDRSNAIAVRLFRARQLLKKGSIP